MNKKITLKKFKLLTALPVMRDAFNVINNERERLSLWFWWCAANVTPTKKDFKTFALSYIMNLKYGKIVHKFNPSELYEEAFIIMAEGKFAGMIGLSCIDTKAQDAELWYFVSKENEGAGVANKAVQYVTNYAITNNIKRLYANISIDNERSVNLINRNGFTFKQNKFANIMTYEKSLVK